MGAKVLWATRGQLPHPLQQSSVAMEKSYRSFLLASDLRGEHLIHSPCEIREA